MAGDTKGTSPEGKGPKGPRSDAAKPDAPKPGVSNKETSILEEAAKSGASSTSKTASDAAAKKPVTTPSAGKAKSAASAKPADVKTEPAKKDSAKNEAPKQEEIKTDPTPTPEKSGAGRFAWMLVFLLLFFIGGVAATPYLLPQVLPLLPQEAKPYFAPLTQNAAAPDVSGLTAKLNQLDASLKDVRQMASSAQDAAKAIPDAAPASVSDADITALSTRLDGLASQLEQLASAQTQQSDSYARLQASIEDIPTGDGGGVSPAVIAALKAQLEDANSARSALSQNVEAVSEQIGALSESVVRSGDDIASAQALSDVATALRERLARLEERLDLVASAAEGAAAPEALDSVNTTMQVAIEGFETRLGALENVRQQATAAMVAGLETARLAQAVGNGRAYAAELKALTQLKAQAGPALPDISDLLADIQGFADTGIPSGATLSAQLEERSREILTAIDTPDGANWWERLLARMRNLVTVRSVGDGAQGGAAPDVLARAEAAARTGDWDAVVAEIDTLPETAKASFGGWWDQARARANAQRALADLNARLGVAASAPSSDASVGPAQ